MQDRAQESRVVYPNPCARCGFCCLSEVCPIGKDFMGIGKAGPCPVLRFDGALAVCRLSELALSVGCPEDQVFAAFGFGSGCCIKARAFKGDQVLDFAGLPADVKRHVVQNLKR